MSVLAATLAAFALGAASAPAASPLENAFGNTVLSTYPDGRTARLWFKRDGTYEGRGRRGKPSAGVWSLKGGKVCMKQTRPFRGPFTFCTDLARGGVGTRWTDRAPTGEKIRVELVAGR